MTDKFLDRLGLIVLYAVFIGISVRIFAGVWKRFWNIELSRKESGALAGAVGAMVIVGLLDKGPIVVVGCSLLVIAGYFGGKLIKKHVRP